MKNPLKPIIALPLALICGAVGFLLRIWLFATGIDGNGLVLQQHPANALLFILTALVIVALFLCLRGLSGTPAYKQLFHPSIPAAAGCVAAAFGILVSAFGELPAVNNRLTLICFVLSLAAAFCLMLIGVARLKGARPRFFLHGCVTVYLMIHLVSQYRVWSAEPQLQIYGFELLASVFLMLSTYQRTTLDAREGSRPVYLFFHYTALFLCCLAIYGDAPLFYLSMAVWTATGGCSVKPAGKQISMRLPKNVSYCLQVLEDAGFSAYVVGGCVRDALLGLTPHDYDMCTSATPEQTARVFSQHPLVRSGEKHGTIGVVLDGQVYEITTFRTEGTYSDNRHPDWVNFVTSLEADLSRRDFTVNAIAYSPGQGFIDPWQGQKDLKNHILRTVGKPAERFHEDALRILRGVRFAARFHLVPEEKTQQAMLALAPLMENLAPERILSELCKLLPHITAEDLIRYAPIMVQIIPELAPSVGFEQHSPHHAYDVYTHTAYAVEATPPEVPLRLAALLHDIGKPEAFTEDENGRGHFYDHAKLGAQMAEEILLRLRASNALREQVVFLILHHMTPFEPDKKFLRRRLGKYGDEAIRQLLALQKADYAGKGVDEDGGTVFEETQRLLTEILQEGACLSVKDLAIRGSDVLELGVKPGPIIGECMTFLLNMVQDEMVSNTKEDLLHAAKQFLDNHKEETL